MSGRGSYEQSPDEPAELACLPPEVRALVHAVDRMRDRWAEADPRARRDLWVSMHTACDAVWGRAPSLT
jgi:hypothetical protein